MNNITNELKNATPEELCEIMDNISYEQNERLFMLLDLRINVCSGWDEVLKVDEDNLA